MKIQLNGKEQELAREATVAELLRMAKVPPEGTAVVVNGRVVAAAERETRTVADGDRVDIVRAIGGG